MKTDKVKYYSYARAISCIAIIFIHVLSQGISQFAASMGNANIAYWAVLNNLKWGVPVFMMVTGSLLLDEEKELSLKKILKGYTLRIVKALIAFGLIFALLDAILAGATGAEGGFGLAFATGIANIFTGQSWAHLWYLYALIGIYLLLPFYRIIAANATKQQMQYLLGIYIAFLSILPFVTGWNVRIGFYIHVSSIYPFWLFFGYYLKKWGVKKSTRHYLLCTVLSVVALVILTVIRWKCSLAPMDRLFNYSSIVVIFQTYGVMGLLRSLKFKNRSLPDRFLLACDKQSFGIYLIHMIFIWIGYNAAGWDPFLHGGFFGILLLAVISFVLAWIATVLLKKLPFFRDIL